MMRVLRYTEEDERKMMAKVLYLYMVQLMNEEKEDRIEKADLGK